MLLYKADFDRFSGKQPSLVELMKNAGVYRLGVDIDFEEGRQALDRATPIDFEKMFD